MSLPPESVERVGIEIVPEALQESEALQGSEVLLAATVLLQAETLDVDCWGRPICLFLPPKCVALGREKDRELLNVSD